MTNSELRLYIRKVIQEGWGGVFNYGPPTEDNSFSALNADEYPDFFDGAANPTFKGKPYPPRTAVTRGVNGNGGPFTDLSEQENVSGERQGLYNFKTTNAKIGVYGEEEVVELSSVVSPEGKIMPPNMDSETEDFVVEWSVEVDRLRNGDGIYNIDIFIHRISGKILWEEWTDYDERANAKKGVIEFDTSKEPYSKFKINNNIEIKAGGQVFIGDVDIDFKRSEITVY